MLNTNKYPAYIIHLEAALERISIIEQISIKLNIPLTLFNASDGSELWNANLKHPWKYDNLTKGMVGCGLSNYNLLKKIYDDSSLEGVFVLEDDARFLTTKVELEELVKTMIEQTENDWDILLLGANEYVESKSFSSIEKVNRFWGSHVLYINRRCIPLLIKTFEDSLKNNIVVYGDWMYNETIRMNNLKVYGPPKEDIKKYVVQTPNLVSALTGKVRT